MAHMIKAELFLHLVILMDTGLKLDGGAGFHVTEQCNGVWT